MNNCQSFNELKWTPIHGILENDQNQNIPLSSFKSKYTVEQNAFYQVNMRPQFRKQLNYDQEAGWSWHKSWNLPELEIHIEGTQRKSNVENDLHAQIFVAKLLKEPNIYKSIGIKGESKKTFLDNQVVFKCLKFTTTSYNNNVKLFRVYLALEILSNSVNGQSIPLQGLISPEIFVDSRKFARFANLPIHQQTLTDLFPPDLLYQQIIKRETKNKSVNQIEVDNSIQGFINYFTACNIRNKIKHPLFLALKFSNPVKLFVDQSLLQSNLNIVTTIQKNLMDNMNNLEQVKKIKLLIMSQSEENSIHKKAIEIIQSLENNCYEIYTQKCYLPKYVQEITDLASLQNQYVSYYQHSSNSLKKTNHLYTVQKELLHNYYQELNQEKQPQTEVNIDNFYLMLNSNNQQQQQTFRNLESIQPQEMPQVKNEVQEPMIKKIKLEQDDSSQKEIKFQSSNIVVNKNQNSNLNYLQYCYMQNYHLQPYYSQQYLYPQQYLNPQYSFYYSQ